MTWNHATVPSWFRRAQWKAGYSKRNGVHYVGDEVIVDLTFPTASYDTFERTATFESGTDAAALSTSDRGYYSAFSAITGTPSYDSSRSAHGTLSGEFATSGDTFSWQLSAAETDHYGRLYLYASGNPSVGGDIIRISQGGNIAVHVSVLTNGRIQIADSGAFGGHSQSSTASIALNQWVRIEWHVVCSTTVGQVEIKYFASPDSSTPTETVTSPATWWTGANTTLFRFGWITGTWGASISMDDTVAAAVSYPGPYNPTVAIANPVTYTVRDYYGTVVSTGTFEEGRAWFVPTAPADGWQPGWYRVYLTGEQEDANKYDSYGVTNFCVIKEDAHFVSMPAGNVVGGYNGEAPDYVMKGVMGLGTTRFIIDDAASYAADLADAELELALTKTYWTDNGIPDSERATREPWCTFPNGGASSPAQLAGVTAVVAALYPDCKYFEGPSNEPDPNNATTASLMQDFADAVHAGHLDAKAIGPCAVSIPPTNSWAGFLNAGGGEYCDAISFHAYNAVTNGDMNLGKYTIEGFLDVLDSYGLADKPLWQTESVGPGSPVYGIYHPRRSRKPLMETLLFERYGVPRERNNWWYDTSHGFWNVPAWIENGDGSLEAAAVLARVLAEETWGKPYASALDFGTLGNAIYLGNVYTNAADESTLVLMATSYMTGASVSLTISGTSNPLEVVDGFGRERTMQISRGRITLSMTDVPMYVRLPVGVSASVYRINGHSPLGAGASVSSAATTKQIDGVTYAVIADDGYQTHYGNATGSAPTIPPDDVYHAPPPSNVTLIWPTDRTIERVIVWCGQAWQHSGVLIDFDVETYNGSTWTLRKTVTKDTPEWFDHGSDGTNSNCYQETYWDEQWIFDVELDAPITCQGVRLVVREASYGGEPLSAAAIANGSGGGQGLDVEGYRIQEVAVVDANRYAVVA